jgi:hypothetical protein
MVAARDTVLAAGDAIADVYASMITAAPLAENWMASPVPLRLPPWR